jgi:cyanate permease
MAGAIIDKYGVRRSIFIGTIIISLSAVLRYFPYSFTSFLPTVALFGIGGPLISIGGPKAISIWFKDKGRSKAVGIYTTGLWLGGIVAMTATNSLVFPLVSYSWRLVFVFYGLVALLIALLWLLISKDNKVEVVTEHGKISELFCKLISIKNVFIILMVALLSFAIEHGFTYWLPKLLENNGMSPTNAGYASAIPLLTGMLAVLIMPIIIPPHFRGRFIALLALLTVVALFVSVYSSGIMLLWGLIIFGVVTPPLFPLAMLVLMDIHEVGSKYMGLAGGIFFCVAEIGGFGGPLVMGVLVDLFGNFLAGIWFLVGLSLIIIILGSLLKTPKIHYQREQGS